MNEAHTNTKTSDTEQCHSNSCERDYLEPENEMFNFKNDQDSGVDGIENTKTTTTCNPVLGKSISPQFVVKTTCNGEWTRTLIDTGATVCFVSKLHAVKIIDNSNGTVVKSTDANLSVRLGNNSRTCVSEYITCTIRESDKESVVVLYIMQLPQGIDIILGLNWQAAMNVLLDTVNRRIIYADYLNNKNNHYGTLNSLVPVLDLMPLKCATSMKAQRNKVYKILGSESQSDVHILSHKSMKALINSMKHGELTYNNYANITRPSDLGVENDSFEDLNIFKINTSKLSKIAKRSVLKARKIKARALIKARGGFNKVNKDYIRKLIAKQRESAAARVPSTDTGLSVGYRAIGKSRVQDTIYNNNINILKKCHSEPTRDETAWKVDIIISPTGTITIPQFDSITGKITPCTEVEKNDTRTPLERAALNILKLYPSTDINNITIESDSVFQLYNNSEEMPIRCNIPPENINKCAPEAQDWTDKLVDGKIKVFGCMNPNVRFNPLKSDIPHKVEFKENTTIPTPHRYRTPEHLVPELKRFIEEMLDKGWIEVGETEFNAPVLILKKPGTYDDGSSKGYRMCSDFRAINAVVKPVSHYLPACDEMWEKLRHANYISVLDVKHGYWACPIAKESRKYLGIMTPWNVYRYRVLPMGYVNASFVFQRFLERKLRKHGLLYEQINVDNSRLSIDNSENIDDDPSYSKINDFGSLKSNRSTLAPTKRPINMTSFVSCY